MGQNKDATPATSAHAAKSWGLEREHVCTVSISVFHDPLAFRYRFRSPAGLNTAYILSLKT